MDIIRYATSEECEKIAPHSDITTATGVITFGGRDFAVVRNCFELDPVLFSPETSDKRKALFLMNLETALRIQGIKELYFTAPADNSTYLSVLKNWGAIDRHDFPVISLKKVL